MMAIHNQRFRGVFFHLFMVGTISDGSNFGAIVVNSLSLAQKEDLFYYLSVRANG